MDDPLRRLIRELRTETCPREVLDRVAERIGPRPRFQPRRLVAFLVAGATALVALITWYPSSRPHLEPAPAAEVQPDHELVIRQTQGTLMYVGQVLLEAAVQAETTVANDAVPSLENAFRTLKNKIGSSI
jgi:hypothetical protein